MAQGKSSRRATPRKKTAKKKATQKKKTVKKKASKKRVAKKTTAKKKVAKKKTTKKTAKKKASAKKTTQKEKARKKTAKRATTRCAAGARATTRSTGARTPGPRVRKKATSGNVTRPTRGAATRRAPAPSRLSIQDQSRVIKVGIHFSNTKTMVAASSSGQPLELKKDCFPNLVGYLKLDPPGRQQRPKSGFDALFAEEAVESRRELDLRRPIRAGAVVDVDACQQFAAYLGSVINPAGSAPLWGVVSIPADATAEQREKASRGVSRLLSRALLVPEPYLAAEGMHLEPAYRAEGLQGRLSERALVVDVGSTKTDLCVLRGGFPRAEDQLGIERGGNFIDAQIAVNGPFYYPGLHLTRSGCREIKEEQSFVGSPEQQFHDVTDVGSELFFLREVIRKACSVLLRTVVEASCQLLGRCGEEADAISHNVILTGGGARIRNFPEALERRLRELGYPRARVVVPGDHRRLVARGALRLAESLGEAEWESFSKENSGARSALIPMKPSGERIASQASSVPDVALVSEPESVTPTPLSGDPEMTDEQGSEERPRDVAADLDELEFFKKVRPLDPSH